MSFIPKFMMYEPTTELEKIPCCWKCKELNPETSYAGTENGGAIYICITCGQQVTSLRGDGGREKLSGLLFKISFSVCIVLTPLLAFSYWSEPRVLFDFGTFFLLCLSFPFGLWAYLKLKLKRRRAIVEEIDRLPKPKPPPKKPNSLPPKIIPPKIN